MKIRFFLLVAFALVISCTTPRPLAISGTKQQIKPVNETEIPVGRSTIAIININIIDGKGGDAVADGSVLVRAGRIEAVGQKNSVKIPDNAEIIDGKGMSILPGFIDSHFHLDRVKDLPALFLQNGVTSLRDPVPGLKPMLKNANQENRCHVYF